MKRLFFALVLLTIGHSAFAQAAPMLPTPGPMPVRPYQSPVVSAPAPAVTPYNPYLSAPAAQPYYGQPGYGYGYGYGYGSYGYFIPEPCRNFPSNRACVMGKIKIDLRQTQVTLRSVLKDRGLPDTSEVDMYVARVDEKTGEPLTILTNEGPVGKHNNWFNNSYRIESGTYLVEFVAKSGGNRLFRDYINVRPEYYTRGETQIVQISPGRFANEPDRAVIVPPPPAQLNLQQWRSGK